MKRALNASPRTARTVNFPRWFAARWSMALASLALCLAVLGCFGRSAVETTEGSEAYDLRRLRWGMDQGQVQDAEKARLAYQDPQLLVYGDKVLDRQMNLEYHLANNQFYRAVYRLAEDYLMEAKYLKDYNDFKTILGKKYGPALRDEMKWHKPHLKGDPSQWGVAVSIGDLSCHTVWETPRTVISLDLTGGNYRVECTIDYLSKELAHLAQTREGDQETPQQSGKTDKRLKKALEEF